jgi:hypothetical protein
VSLVEGAKQLRSIDFDHCRGRLGTSRPGASGERRATACCLKKSSVAGAPGEPPSGAGASVPVEKCRWFR